MDSDDQRYTYNELSNDDKALLLSYGYVPGELSPSDARDILEDLRDQTDGDDDSDRPSGAVSGDEYDGTQ
ncbi:MAG TPA: hypothetical protein VGM08_04365 [Candidatus Saccharimonadales bacterium]|jgi:hypothetical protein